MSIRAYYNKHKEELLRMSKQYAQNDHGNDLVPEGDGVLGRVDGLDSLADNDNDSVPKGYRVLGTVGGLDILTEAMKREIKK